MTERSGYRLTSGSECFHKPNCPFSTTRWNCARRTDVEDAVSRGDIERLVGEQLLKRYGMPMTPERNVTKTGILAKQPEQRRLV
jgi:hypothetical protein